MTKMQTKHFSFFVSHFSVSIVLFALCSCSDWRDGIPNSEGNGSPTTQEAISFTTNVNSIRQATRADNTIINKGEINLLPTATSGKQVGLFAAYTGQYRWSALVTLYKCMEDKTLSNAEYTVLHALPEFSSYADADALQSAAPTILNDYYSANQMYNVPADIGSSGTLTYTPLSFWPNNKLPDPATEHEYMTFWAYYPYNETSALGEYGISMTNDALGEGMGMGKVKFVMHPDAAQQNDFLISAPVTDCNRDKYMLLRTDDTPTYDPKPVQFRLYHMLAQVRFYAFIRGDDKMVYQDVLTTQAMLDTWNGTAFTDTHLATNATKKYFRKSDATNDGVAAGMWLENGFVINGVTIDDTYISNHGEELPAVMDQYGTWIELKVGDKVPDESKCVRWDRTNGVWDINHTRRRANITYTMQLNNIRTSATFGPNYSPSGTTIDVEPATTLGSATVNHYIMNPYWFTFQDGKRIRLNDNYMFGYFEDTPVYKQLNATTTMTGYDDIDGINWTDLTDPLDYITSKSTDEKKEIAGIGDYKDKHYNYAPGNILLVVPQELKDEDVPHVIITAKGKRTVWNNTEKKWTEGETLTARVTVNMLKMGITWESGFIYCYAFLDEFRPGDDKVRGPESITVLFNKNWHTDQW